jgi:hypothetical protein
MVKDARFFRKYAIAAFFLIWGIGYADVIQAQAAQKSNEIETTTPSITARAAPLNGIQPKIYSASMDAYKRNDFSSYDTLEGDLRKINVSGSPTLSYYQNYWFALLYYEKSLSLMRAKSRDLSKQVLEQSIATLKSITPQDNEVSALLAMALGLNLQFVPQQSIIIAVQDVNAALGAALEGKPSLRSYYANAISDYNTPLIYGGGRKAEALARQAIANQGRRSARLRPTWGRDLATALLIRILIDKKKMAEARALYQKAKLEFPNSVSIDELKSKIQ